MERLVFVASAEFALAYFANLIAAAAAAEFLILGAALASPRCSHRLLHHHRHRYCWNYS